MEGVINKAKESCKNSGINVFDCFVDVDKSIISGKGRKSIIKDYKLNRYACYLIAQNGDSRKEVIANLLKLLRKQDGTMSEELPTPKKSLKQFEKENMIYYFQNNTNDKGEKDNEV